MPDGRRLLCAQIVVERPFLGRCFGRELEGAHWGSLHAVTGALKRRRDLKPAALAPLFDNVGRYYRRVWHDPSAKFALR